LRNLALSRPLRLRLRKLRQGGSFKKNPTHKAKTNFYLDLRKGTPATPEVGGEGNCETILIFWGSIYANIKANF
jgi:hypothetical protein